MYQRNGAKALKRLEDFKDDFVFSYKDTEKNLLIYNDEQIDFDLQDYQGNTEKITQKYGAVLVPTTYELGKAEDYMNLISENSSKRSVYNER